MVFNGNASERDALVVNVTTLKAQNAKILYWIK